MKDNKEAVAGLCDAQSWIQFDWSDFLNAGWHDGGGLSREGELLQEEGREEGSHQGGVQAAVQHHGSHEQPEETGMSLLFWPLSYCHLLVTSAETWLVRTK